MNRLHLSKLLVDLSTPILLVAVSCPTLAMASTGMDSSGEAKSLTITQGKPLQSKTTWVRIMGQPMSTDEEAKKVCSDQNRPFPPCLFGRGTGWTGRWGRDSDSTPMCLCFYQ